MTSNNFSISGLKPRTVIERVVTGMFCLVVLVFALMVYKMYIQPVPVFGLMTTIDNGDDICDEAELMTARYIDITPCGQYVRFLLDLNGAI